MYFRKIITLFLSIGILVLSGCAAQKKHIQLSEQFWQDKPKVSIAYYKPAEPGMVVFGKQGLLDIAITRATNNRVISRLKRVDLSWYPQITNYFAQQLKERSINAEVVSTPIINDKNLLSNANGDQLLIIKLQAIGIRREYTMGFISSAKPTAYCVLSGELIDRNNHKKPLWRSEIEIMQPIQEPWDQPSEFPNLMKALDTTIASAQTELADSFFSGH